MSTTPAAIEPSWSQTFRLTHNQAEGWRVPVPTDPPAAIANEVAEYRAAFEAWDDITDALHNVDGQFTAAAATDAATVRTAAKAGTLTELATLTPAQDALKRRCAEALATHADVDRRCLNAISALMGAVESNRETLTAQVDARLEELEALMAPYRTAVQRVSEHATNLVYLRDWLDNTDGRDLPSFNGRPDSALPALPPAITRKG